MSYLEPIDHASEGIGETYDELPLWSAPFGMMLLDCVPLRPDITILDVGAGTGFLSIELAERCGPAARVIAVDPWRGAMSRLRRKLEQRGVTNVRLIEQDAATLDLPDDSIDLVVSNLGINNFDDPDAVLRVCHRVTKQGGTLALTTNLVGHMAEFYEAYRAVLVELGQHDRLAALEAHVTHRATVESTRRRLEGAGFRVADVTTGSFRMRFADGSALLRHHFIRLGFVQAWKAVADESAVERTFEALERRLNEIAQQRGALALTIPMACVVARKPG